MKFGALCNLASGTIEAIKHTNRMERELPLFFRLSGHFRPDDIWVGDALYGAYVAIGHSVVMGVDAVARLEGSRKPHLMKDHPLGPNEWLVTWTKPNAKPGYLNQRQWEAIPGTLKLRMVRVTLNRPGFKPLKFYVVTTLLDRRAYPGKWIGEMYLRRWRLEVGLRDLKTTMKMEMLRTKTPRMIYKEFLMFIIAHNMIRCLITQAAAEHNQPVLSISFKGAIDVVCLYANVLMCARSAKTRKKLFPEMIGAIADQKVPFRPNRIEPRAVKRRPKTYPPLMATRKQYRSQFRKQFLK